MSDFAAVEHRKLTNRMNTLWPWFNGNGNIGAKDRLQKLEDLADGKEETAAMKQITNHLAWHEKMSGRRWELYLGFILVIAGNIITFLLLKGGV